jgi:hypothetical protein
MTQHASIAETHRGPQLVNALRATTTVAVLAILWQGATAGGLLMQARTFLDLHEAGAVAVHVLTGVAALLAFLAVRATRGPRWPAALGALVFVASFVQAALGDDETMWAHVPGALLLMLGSAVLLVWAWRPRR